MSRRAAVVKQIDVDPSALIAAGAKQLAVVSRSKKELTLWNFAAFEQDKTLPLPAPLGTEDIGYIAMGETSAGPLYFYSPGAKRTSALDLPKGTVRAVNWSSWSPTNAYGPLDLRVSPDGQTILGHGGGWAGLELIRFDGPRQTEITSKFNFSGGVFGILSADGQRIFLPGETVDRAGTRNEVPGYLVPAREPGYFLGLKMNLPPTLLVTGGVIPGAEEVTLYAEPASRLTVLEGLPELKEGTKIAWDKQIHWYPRTGLLVTLANKNKLVLRHLDLPQQIEKAGRDYLLAHFRPIAAKVGQPLSHKLDVRSKRGGLDFKLDKGPDGMKVSPAGEVQWTVPPDFPDSDALALITIRDAAGQETTARLRIWIGDE